MKEFIDKLIGRLEERRSLHNANNDLDIVIYATYNKAISIVNELAEEYNNDSCEWGITISSINDSERWAYYNKMSCQPNTRNLFPTFHFSEDEQKNFLKYCPHCGKKIKFTPCKKGE